MATISIVEFRDLLESDTFHYYESNQEDLSEIIEEWDQNKTDEIKCIYVINLEDMEQSIEEFGILEFDQATRKAITTGSSQYEFKFKMIADIYFDGIKKIFDKGHIPVIFGGFEDDVNQGILAEIVPNQFSQAEVTTPYTALRVSVGFYEIGD